MRVEEVLSRLQGVRRSRDSWIARCPAHQDRSPSLSIRRNDGKTLLHCFAGCMTHDICAALKIEMRDLFNGPRTFQRPKPLVLRDAERQIVDLRARLTPSERDRVVTVVLADPANPDAAMARALALTVEGDLCQVAMKESEQWT